MSGPTKCGICDKPFRFRWTDTHGVGACVTCGAPYRIYHYEDDKRVEKPPELSLREEWVPLTKRYWKEVGRNCAPGAFNFPGSSYEVASREDFESLKRWMEAHTDEWPKEAEEMSP